MPFLHRKSWTIPRVKSAAERPLPFREMRDFKVLFQIFLPAFRCRAPAKLAEAEADRWRSSSRTILKPGVAVSEGSGPSVSALIDPPIISLDSGKVNSFICIPIFLTHHDRDRIAKGSAKRPGARAGRVGLPMGATDLCLIPKGEKPKV